MSIALKRLIVLLLVSTTVSCSDSGTSKLTPDPETPAPPSNPNVPSPPTRLDLCSEGVVQNLAFVAYAHGVAASFVIAPVTWPLESFSDPTYYEGSTIRTQIVYHAMGGDQLLYDETAADNVQQNIQLSPSSTPAYTPAIDDELTVTLTTTIKSKYSGGTHIYDEHTDSLDFKLVDPAVNLFKVGERRTFDNQVCPTFFNPLLSLNSAATGTPNEFDLYFGATLFVSPLEPIAEILSSNNATPDFERDFHIKLKGPSGTVLGQIDYDVADPSSSYISPSDTIASALVPGTYKMEVSSALRVNFGSGLQDASVSNEYTLTIADTTGEMTLNGNPLINDEQFVFGIDEFN